jgi:hypothetical protein
MTRDKHRQCGEAGSGKFEHRLDIIEKRVEVGEQDSFLFAVAGQIDAQGHDIPAFKKFAYRCVVTRMGHAAVNAHNERFSASGVPYPQRALPVSARQRAGKRLCREDVSFIMMREKISHLKPHDGRGRTVEPSLCAWHMA